MILFLAELYFMDGVVRDFIPIWRMLGVVLDIVLKAQKGNVKES